jgi:hypothetical protein
METRGTIQHLVQEALDAAGANKPVEIQLAWYVEDYKVLAVQNTTILKPGEWLSVEAAQQLCDTKGWTVKSADNDVIATLFGLGAGALSSAARV